MNLKGISKKFILAATITLLLNVYGCKKYDDGPGFSLLTKKARLTGEWEVVEVGGENVGGGNEIILEFEKDGDFSIHTTFTYYGYSYSYNQDGDWDWENKKESIEVTVDGDKVEWDIKRLTNKELWFEDEDNTDWELEKKD